MSRPKAEIDWKVVGAYLQAHCDGAAIAGLLGINPETLYNRCKEDNNMGFSEFSQIKKAEGITAMEYSIFTDARKHGGVDRIFWLKNKAGWKDRTEMDLNANIRIDPFLALMKAASKKEAKQILSKSEENDNSRDEKDDI